MMRRIIAADSQIDHGEAALAAAPSMDIQHAPVPGLGGRAARGVPGAAVRAGA